LDIVVEEDTMSNMKSVGRRCTCAVLTAAVLLVGPAQGADTTQPPFDPWQNMISPDRPGAATPPSVMDRGVFQLETSFESQITRPPDAPDVTTLDFPTLARYGVGHRLEFRLESNTVSHEQSVTGFADVSLETKWLALDRPAGAIPSVALLPTVSLASGTSDFTAGKVQAGISGLLGWTLRDGTTLALDSDVSRVVENSGDPYVWELGTQGAFEIPVRRNWAISGDLFVSSVLEGDSTAPWGADAAVEFYPNPDTQLDLIAIHTFTEPGTATSLQVGFSRRIGTPR
jgi:hypothetical protein